MNWEGENRFRDALAAAARRRLVSTGLARFREVALEEGHDYRDVPDNDLLIGIAKTLAAMNGGPGASPALVAMLLQKLGACGIDFLRLVVDHAEDVKEEASRRSEEEARREIRGEA